MANNIQPSRKGYMNTLAETMSQQINPKPYHTKLSSNTVAHQKVSKMHKAERYNGLRPFAKKKTGY